MFTLFFSLSCHSFLVFTVSFSFCSWPLHFGRFHDNPFTAHATFFPYVIPVTSSAFNTMFWYHSNSYRSLLSFILLYSTPFLMTPNNSDFNISKTELLTLSFWIYSSSSSASQWILQIPLHLLLLEIKKSTLMIISPMAAHKSITKFYNCQNVSEIWPLYSLPTLTYCKPQVFSFSHHISFLFGLYVPVLPNLNPFSRKQAKTSM